VGKYSIHAAGLFLKVANDFLPCIFLGSFFPFLQEIIGGNRQSELSKWRRICQCQCIFDFFGWGGKNLEKLILVRQYTLLRTNTTPPTQIWKSNFLCHGYLSFAEG